MTVSQFEVESGNGEQGVIFDDSSKGSPASSGSIQSKRNPPARNTSRFWFERFLAVIQRQNPAVIDASFVRQIAPSNEGKILTQLKFLGVIDEQGKPTNILPMLNMVGDAQKKAFRQIASEAYRELEVEIKMDRAVPDDVVNFFIRKYAFTRDKAVNAAKFYLYLLEKGGAQVSRESGSFLNEKASGPGQPNSSLSVASVKVSERPNTRTIVRDARTSSVLNSTRLNQNRKGRTADVGERSPIQAIINVKLEKDTPKEYWDRVLALLGERQQAGLSNVALNDSNADRVENLEQDSSDDAAFT